MKNKLKSIIAVIWLILSSAMAYYCMVLGIFVAVETERWISSKDFYIHNVVDSVIEVMLIVSYIFTYFSAMIYLCKQMYKIKKWMVCSKHKIKYVFHKKENRCIIKVKEVHRQN